MDFSLPMPVFAGVCEKICAVSNNVVLERTPSWQHRCEQCFTCLHWCPQAAIQVTHDTEHQNRYQHPGVKASDIMT